MVGAGATIIGCAEGEIEGEVKEGNNRIVYRWRLKADKFGMKPTIKSIMKGFWWNRKQIKDKVVDKLMDENGDKMLYVTGSTAKHYPSWTISKLHKGPSFANVTR